MKGRHEHCRISDVEGEVMDFRDLLAVSMRGDNLQAFLSDWESVIIHAQ